jgi:hypothetical protein
MTICIVCAQDYPTKHFLEWANQQVKSGGASKKRKDSSSSSSDSDDESDSEQVRAPKKTKASGKMK